MDGPVELAGRTLPAADHRHNAAIGAHDDHRALARILPAALLVEHGPDGILRHPLKPGIECGMNQDRLPGVLIPHILLHHIRQPIGIVGADLFASRRVELRRLRLGEPRRIEPAVAHHGLDNESGALVCIVDIAGKLGGRTQQSHHQRGFPQIQFADRLIEEVPGRGAHAEASLTEIGAVHVAL